MGVAPHKWLLTRRIEVAKERLRDHQLSLLDVALACVAASYLFLMETAIERTAHSRGPRYAWIVRVSTPSFASL
jgi:hypothetical protein